MQNLENKTSFITGGSKGIGLGIAEAMVQAGMRVAITSRNLHEVQEAAAMLNKIKEGSALGIQADVRDLEAQKEAVEQMMKKWETLDVVIANAGVGHFGNIEELSVQQWQDTIDINLTGVFNSVKASIAGLKQSKGFLITIASLAGTNFFAGGAAYNASKFGLVGFTQAIMLDLRQYGIRVSTIMPGSVATHFNDHSPNEQDAWKIQPDDIGQMVVDLLRLNARTLPSKIEVRPSMPGK
ncbi:MAG: SDR family oxidoreductase [Bacteroidota bacterium]|nr:SDR family oxidoreductase [Bacteroidota bacterium]